VVPLSDDRGQALLLAVVLIAIGAVAIVGLRQAQERILAGAGSVRAGEAAVEAASAVIADAYATELAVARLRDRDAPHVDMPRLLAAPATREAARAAAATVAAANGAIFASDIDAGCAGRFIEVRLRLADRIHRAVIEADECSRR